MDKSIFIRADELSVELDVSKALAYKMINQWNEELKAKRLYHCGWPCKPPVLLRKDLRCGKGESRCLRIRMPKKGTWYAAFLLSGLEGIKKKEIKARLSHEEALAGNAHFWLLQQAADLDHDI